MFTSRMKARLNEADNTSAVSSRASCTQTPSQSFNRLKRSPAQRCLVPFNHHPSLLSAALPSSDSTTQAVRQLLPPLQSVSNHNNSAFTSKPTILHTSSSLPSPNPHHDRTMAASTAPLPHHPQHMSSSTIPPPQEQQQKQQPLSLSHDPGGKDVDSSKPQVAKPPSLSHKPDQGDKLPDSSKPSPKSKLSVSLPPKGGPPSVQDRLILFAYQMGTTGCLAFALAWAAHLDLLKAFRWESADIQTALHCVPPLLVIDAVLLLPDFGEVQESNSNPELEGAAVKKTTGDGSPVGTSDGTVEGVKLLQAVNPVQTFAYGMKLAQTQAFCNGFRARMRFPPAADASAAVVESFATQLLYTGVFFGVPASWLTDRLFEAGAEDTILLPFHILSADTALTLTTVQGGQCIIAVLYATLMAAGLSQQGWKKFNNVVGDLLMRVVVSLSERAGTPLTKAPWEPKVVKRAPGSPAEMPKASLGLAGAVGRACSLTRNLTVYSVLILTGGNLAATVTATTVEALWLVLLKQVPKQRLAEETKRKELKASEDPVELPGGNDSNGQ